MCRDLVSVGSDGRLYDCDFNQMLEVPIGARGKTVWDVDSFEEVKDLHSKLAGRDVKALPLSHGNTLSLYFGDPEGNGIEVFWDTPWHVDQPQGKVWDPALDEEAALACEEENFRDESSFVLREAAAGTYVNRP